MTCIRLVKPTGLLLINLSEASSLGYVASYMIWWLSDANEEQVFDIPLDFVVSEIFTRFSNYVILVDVCSQLGKFTLILVLFSPPPPLPHPHLRSKNLI